MATVYNSKEIRRDFLSDKKAVDSFLSWANEQLNDSD